MGNVSGSRTHDGDIDHIDVDISIRRIAVVIRAVLGVLLGFFDLALLNDLFAFDHAAAAVLAAVLAFLTAGAAARAALVVFDLRTGDLLFRLLLGAETDA